MCVNYDWSGVTKDTAVSSPLTLVSMIVGGLKRRNIARYEPEPGLSETEQLRKQWAWVRDHYAKYLAQVKADDIMFVCVNRLCEQVYDNQAIVEKIASLLDRGTKLLVIGSAEYMGKDDDYFNRALVKRVLGQHGDDVRFLRSKHVPEFHSRGVIRAGGEFRLFVLEGVHPPDKPPTIFDYGPFMADDIEEARRAYEEARESAELLKL